jgi:hypothetical protein
MENTDRFLAHEVLGRASVIADMLNNILCKYLYIYKNFELNEMALKIEEDINMLYQKIGQVINEEKDINSV